MPFLPDDSRNYHAPNLSSISDNIVSTISFSNPLSVKVYCDEPKNNVLDDVEVLQCQAG